MNPGKTFGRRTPLLLACVLAGSGLLGAADDANSGGLQTTEIERLRTVLAGQQKQLQTLQQTIEKQQILLEKALGGTSNFNGIGQVASTSPMIPVAPLPAAALPNPVALPQAGGAARPASEGSPLQIRIGDATITPVGFMDLTNT